MMKSSYVLLLAVIIGIAMPGLVLAQTEDTIPVIPYLQGTFYFPQFTEFGTGGGARALGMGGAGLALASGDMAYSWNPAAMIYEEKASIGLQFGSVSDKHNTTGGAITDLSNLSASVFSVPVKTERFNLDYSGFTAPFNLMDRKWAAGGGYHTAFLMNYEYDSPGDLGGRQTFKSNRSVDAISVAAAHELSPGLGVGLNVNFLVRGPESNLFMDNFVVATYPNGTADSIDYWINEKANYSGVNLDLGLSEQFGTIKAGVVVHTPYTLKSEVVQTRSLMTPPNPIGEIDRYTKKIDIPFGMSFGLAATPVEKLTAAVDINYRSMSNSKVTINYEQTRMQDTTITPNWSNILQFGIGLEYNLSVGSAGLPLRVGYKNNPSLEKKVLRMVDGQATEYGGKLNGSILTFGTGLHFEKIWMDLAYQFGGDSYNSVVSYFSAQETFKLKRDYSRLYVSAGMYF